MRAAEREHTQREADRRAGLRLEDWMVEDPRKMGVPLCLQVQNRRSSPEEMEAWRAHSGKPEAVDPYASRTDFKPMSMSWLEWDALLASEAEKKRAASLERIAALRAKKGLPPPAPKRASPPSASRKDQTVAGAGYKGHIAGSAVAEVHRAFDAGGIDAAIEAGKAVRYHASTVRRLAQKWSKQ